MKRLIIILYIVSLFSVGCFDAFSSFDYDKRLTTLLANTTINPPAAPSIYAGGMSNDSACYWKNGRKVELGYQWTIVRSIYVSGADVYAGGFGPNNACYWKNLDRIDLWDGIHGSEVFSIFVSGSDVYAGGYWVDGSVYVACYWKNGVKTDVGNGTDESMVNAIAVSGDDVYTGGYQYIGSTRYGCYWKNTERTNRDAEIKSIVVSGDDTYMAGANYYWKNDERFEVGSGLTGPTLNAMYISGADVYAGGRYYDTSLSHEVACYWKNGERVDLGLEKASVIQSLFVSGSDVYAGGLWSNSGVYTACYWVNGVRTDLDEYNSYVYSIFIK
jgi:hypothetical protein